MGRCPSLLGKLDRVEVELVYPTIFGSAKKIVIRPSKKTLPELFAHLQQGLPEKDEGGSPPAPPQVIERQTAEILA